MKFLITCIILFSPMQNLDIQIPEYNIEDASPPYEYPTVWDALADCESGEWNGDAEPMEGTARWDLPPGEHIFEGGLQFHPRTWDWLAGEVLGDEAPPSAHLATRVQQIRVGEAVRKRQGWRAWPVCSKKLGLR